MENIDSRRAAVRQAFDANGESVPAPIVRALADEFACSAMTIKNDVNWIRQVESNGHYVTPSTRAHVLFRDGHTCQYCGYSQEGAMVVDHVIPRLNGGHAQPYNLVACCVRCNLLRAENLMLPANLEAITRSKPIWRHRVQEWQDAWMRSKKPGPKPTLVAPERMNVNITAAHREKLEEYCKKHGVNMSEAIRRAIDKLD